MEMAASSSLPMTSDLSLHLSSTFAATAFLSIVSFRFRQKTNAFSEYLALRINDALARITVGADKSGVREE